MMKFLEVLAHEGEEVAEVVQPALDEVIRTNSLKYSLIAGGILLGVGVLALLFKNASEKIKYWLFGAVVAVAILNTIYLAGSTIYLNQTSQTGGPVHWHADYEVWNCGELVELKDPAGLSNKVGTEVVHEHNDNRVHIEGVILEKHDASIGHFFDVLGGDLEKGHMALPTEDGLLDMEDGKGCPDGQEASLQVFVYQTKGDSFSQQKLINNPQDYIISPFGQVPPGDCIIIEFGPQKDKTDKLCAFYKVAKEKGELHER